MYRRRSFSRKTRHSSQCCLASREEQALGTNAGTQEKLSSMRKEKAKSRKRRNAFQVAMEESRNGLVLELRPQA
jgi:hypothetical protein